MRRLSVLAAFAGLIVGIACSDITHPSSPLQFSKQIAFTDLNNILGQLPTNGAARVKIELPPSGVIAREVKVKDPEEVNETERVEGRITDLVVTVAGKQGTLTLAPGFHITFTADSKFEAGEVEVTFQQFVDRVNAALAQNPKVLLPLEAERAPTSPLVLGPSDAFPAAKLELQGAVGEPKVQINITSANLVAPGSGDCQASLSSTLKGCLKVLGLTIGIDATTELKAMLPAVVETRFEGILDCPTLKVASAHEGSFALVGQHTTINVSATTKVEFESGGDERLADLNAVNATCGATPPQQVRAEGEGVPGATAGTLQATEVEFEVEEQEAAVQQIEFKGPVSAVDLDHRTLTVMGEMGTVTMHVASDNLIDPASDLKTLQAVRDALAATPPQQVQGEGRANPGAAGSPPEATEVKFEVAH